MSNLNLHKINVHYDNDFHAVRDVSLEIKESEIITLLGPSGCGKTSILRTIAGFVEPSSGSIQLGENDITDLPPQKRNMGMIFQSYALWPHMTVRDNIAYGLKIREMEKEDIVATVNKMVNQVKLEGHDTKHPAQLSGGQQQRVALARAIAIEPVVLLCDEPLSNLDYKLRLSLRNEIRDVAKRNQITVVYVTHDQTEALAISDRIAVISDGVIVQLGTPFEIYNDPDTLFVATFIGENNILTGEVESLTDKGVKIKLDSEQLIEVDVKGGLIKGDKVTVVTRFDAVLISEKDEPNRLTGKIKHVSYMGHVLQIELELKDGSSVMVNESDEIDKYRMKTRGDDISVTINKNKILLFKDETRVR